ncbi:MAG: ribosome maturation factor RimM, partial [Acholeplasmataceae bacterium]
EVKVNSLTDFNRFKVDKIITINSVDYKITSVKHQQHNLIIGLSNISSIEEAKLLNNLTIYTKEEPNLKTDEYHLPKLIGLNVYKKDKTLIGIVESLIPQHKGYLLRIETKDKEYLLVPFIKEFVKEVTNSSIYIDEIPGLI